MNRRKFGGLVGALAMWPLSGYAQTPALPVIGFLSSRSPSESAHLLAAWHKGLAEAGYVERQNVAIEYRWAEGQYNRLPDLAADLVRRKVTVISTAGGTVSALAAKAATTSIPIVFLSGGDLIKLGLVASLNRPGGNVTGVSQFSSLLVAKRLELLRELKPATSQVALLLNPNNPNKELDIRNAKEASTALKLKLVVLNAQSTGELDAAFAAMRAQKLIDVVVVGDPFFDSQRARIVMLAARHAIVAVYPWPDYVREGGLMSYGVDPADTYRQAGIYTGRILKGAKPEELPVLQPTKLQLLVNLKTANSLKITIPPSVLLRADHRIE